MSERYKLLSYGVALGLLSGLLASSTILIVARRPEKKPILLQEPPTPLPVRVHIVGAVVAPGVYSLPAGSICQTALEMAGGVFEDADLSRINLAAPVLDGDQIIVPTLPPTATPVPPTPTPVARQITQEREALSAQRDSLAAGSGLVNINTASAAELDSLPGIGPAIAQRIIEYRTVHGPFTSIEDIQRVSGIGPALFAKIKDLITI